MQPPSSKGDTGLPHPESFSNLEVLLDVVEEEGALDQGNSFSLAFSEVPFTHPHLLAHSIIGALDLGPPLLLNTVLSLLFSGQPAGAHQAPELELGSSSGADIPLSERLGSRERSSPTCSPEPPAEELGLAVGFPRALFPASDLQASGYLGETSLLTPLEAFVIWRSGNPGPRPWPYASMSCQC